MASAVHHRHAQLCGDDSSPDAGTRSPDGESVLGPRDHASASGGATDLSGPAHEALIAGSPYDGPGTLEAQAFGVDLEEVSLLHGHASLLPTPAAARLPSPVATGPGPGGGGVSLACAVSGATGAARWIHDLDPGLFNRKPIVLILAEMAEGGAAGRLKRELGPVGLICMGVGAIIGTGIFVLVGKAARDTAGPALAISFAVAGLACLFAALCYAEFASMASVAGSAYTYAYATLGELMAWIIGWDLVLEYAVSCATVAHGWSKYFADFLAAFGVRLPKAISDAPFDFDEVTGEIYATGAVCDVPAIAITAVLTLVLIRGVKESATFNAAMVAVKLAVVAFVIIAGGLYVRPANWAPFAPYGYGGVGFFGYLAWGDRGHGGSPVGVMAGAALIFFAYIGFDAVSTQAEEAKNPKRDMPIGILGSLLISTVLYVAVVLVLTGMVPYQLIDKEAPISAAFGAVGLPWARVLVSLGALTGITSVLLVTMLGQPRIFLAMARDGLLPPSFFGAIHPVYGTPHLSTLLTGLIVATAGALLPLDVLAELTNIGTLFAFVVVCAAVLVMRRLDPHAPRPFRVPWSPLTPSLGIALCMLLMLSLSWANWARLAAWLGLGFGIYFGYGRRHSKLRALLRDRAAAAHAAGGGRGPESVALAAAAAAMARERAKAVEMATRASERSALTPSAAGGGELEDGEA